MDTHEGTERRLSREQLLKVAAAAGGAGLLGGRIGTAQAALDWLNAESGRLQVLDWAGYGNDGGQPMFAQYVKTHPNNKPQFTYMTNEADALAKIHAGLKPDLFRPYVGWVKYFATSGLVEPWDPKQIPNLKQLNPFMVKAGQYTSSTSATRGGSRGSTTLSRVSPSPACTSASRIRGIRPTPSSSGLRSCSSPKSTSSA